MNSKAKLFLKSILPNSFISIVKRGVGVAGFYARGGGKTPAGNVRLHLGCGEIRLPGFVNVDFLRTNATDCVSDITKLPEFSNQTVIEIYACHVLEHLSHEEVPGVLKRWHALLVSGGVLRISVPDLDKIVTIYSKNMAHFHRDGNTPWIGLIYGGQKDQYDFHKTGFNAYWLSKLLQDAGFVEAAEYPHVPHFCGEDVSDASLLNAPFGEFFSLNMMAVKR